MMMPQISVFAGRVHKATVKDMADLSRGFGYLIYSRDLKMRYKCGGSVKVDVYVDASWAVHDDSHGRSGIIVMLAGELSGVLDCEAEDYHQEHYCIGASSTLLCNYTLASRTGS